MFAQIIIILALLLLLVGMIMVLLDAFNESTFWGLLLLLVPPLIPVYCFVKWRRDSARNGFAMSLVGVVLIGIGVYGGGAKHLPFIGEQEIVKNLPTAVPDDEPLPNEALASQIELDDGESYDPILSTDKDRFSSKEIEALAPKDDKTISGQARPKIRKVPLNAENVGSAIGSNVEVVFVDGVIKRGRLIANSEESISVEEVLGGGQVSFEYKYDKIKSVSKLVDPSAAAPPPEVKIQDPEVVQEEEMTEAILNPEVVHETKPEPELEVEPEPEVELEPEVSTIPDTATIPTEN